MANHVSGKITCIAMYPFELGSVPRFSEAALYAYEIHVNNNDKVWMFYIREDEEEDTKTKKDSLPFLTALQLIRDAFAQDLTVKITWDGSQALKILQTVSICKGRVGEELAQLQTAEVAQIAEILQAELSHS